MTLLSTHCDPFSIKVQMEKTSTNVLLQMNSKLLRTKDLPITLSFLSTHFPFVLETICFNDWNKPFRDEVLDTEIGHLFEHVVLAELAVQGNHTLYRGWTEWNWKNEIRGSFHINLNAGKDEKRSVEQAITKARFLLTRLLTSETDGWGIRRLNP